MLLTFGLQDEFFLFAWSVFRPVDLLRLQDCNTTVAVFQVFIFCGVVVKKLLWVPVPSNVI
jgi:hypothetical protein